MKEIDKMLAKVWLAAAKKGSVTLPFENQKQAAKYRFALYDVVKKLRDKMQHLDVVRAADECQIVWGDDRKSLIVEKNDEKSVIGMIELVLGEDENENLFDENEKIFSPESTFDGLADNEIAASLAKVQALLADTPAKTDSPPEPEIRVTPYYAREVIKGDGR